MLLDSWVERMTLILQPDTSDCMASRIGCLAVFRIAGVVVVLTEFYRLFRSGSPVTTLCCGQVASR